MVGKQAENNINPNINEVKKYISEKHFISKYFDFYYFDFYVNSFAKSKYTLVISQNMQTQIKQKTLFICIQQFGNSNNIVIFQ